MLSDRSQATQKTEPTRTVRGIAAQLDAIARPLDDDHFKRKLIDGLKTELLKKLPPKPKSVLIPDMQISAADFKIVTEEYKRLLSSPGDNGFTETIRVLKAEVDSLVLNISGGTVEVTVTSRAKTIDELREGLHPSAIMERPPSGNSAVGRKAKKGDQNVPAKLSVNRSSIVRNLIREITHDQLYPGQLLEKVRRIFVATHVDNFELSERQRENQDKVSCREAIAALQQSMPEHHLTNLSCNAFRANVEGAVIPDALKQFPDLYQILTGTINNLRENPSLDARIAYVRNWSEAKLPLVKDIMASETSGPEVNNGQLEQ